MTVRIVTDSACDLPQAVADTHGIEIVPLTIRFGGMEFTDRLDLSVAEFWRRSAESAVLPETAAPAPGQYEQTFRRLAANGTDGIVCISLSGELSATIQSARLAADAVADTIRVEVVDSRSVTMGLGMIVLTAARRAEEGADVDTIVKEAVSLAERTRVWGALDTLENLKKGGRIGGAKALLASVLSIKPIIEVRNGKVEEGGKQRTRARALAFLIDKVREQGPVENLAVIHADTSDIDAFIERLRPFATGEIVVGDIGPVIGSHSGRGAIGVVFQLPT
jgi:DegV family protein with EDD domain